MLKQIKDFYRIGLTWISNALEGNSLIESETKVLIEDGLTVGGRFLRDIFEVVDHAKVYNYMFTLIANKEITEGNILYLHKLIYQNIEVYFAAILHKKFVFIHLFKDGNGRVVRLLMNTALILDGFLPALIPPILRNGYISLLEKAHTNDSPFIDFIAERVGITKGFFATS